MDYFSTRNKYKGIMQFNLHASQQKINVEFRKKFSQDH